MKFRQYSALTLIVIALVAVAYGINRTDREPVPPAPRGARRSPSDRTIIVDQSSLTIAEQLVRMPTTADERPFAEEALRVADQEMDLAFASAVRMTANRPRATSDTAKEADARLRQSLLALAADSSQVASLTAALAKANPADALSLTDRLNLAKAQAELHQDEADDARGDLRRAGGDPQGRMQEMIDEHEAASQGSDTLRIVVTNPGETHGLIRLVQSWQTLHDKKVQLRRAKNSADSLAIVFKRRHDRVEARAAARHDSATARLSHDSSTALLADTQRRALDEKARATLDTRVDNQHRLSETYAGWMGVIGAQELAVVNRALRGVAVILVIMLLATLLTRWIEHLLGAKAMDQRHTQTLYMVTRVSLQVLAVLLILLVIFGPPNNLGTFLGLAGAGLTVALKDFIIAFIGWFVLMGSNGIRIGDLVEINGVTGEVVQLGMFYTVLLETGGWTESGHPTGRRVTFTNGFAIEGHYFNFSTSGRWLWDEVRIIVPTGHDPYAIAEALQKQAEEATAESAREAEVQWREARRSPQGAAPTGGASVNLKPVPGGVEITLRYITRATEREALRSKLYHTAVDLLGGVAAAPKAAPVESR
jgi:small-conductance mechanosensitive channel